MADRAGFKVDQIEVALILPGQSHEPLHVLNFDAEGAASGRLGEYDDLIRQQRSNSDAGELEVEMRLQFTRRIASDGHHGRAAWECLQARGTSFPDEL